MLTVEQLDDAELTENGNTAYMIKVCPCYGKRIDGLAEFLGEGSRSRAIEIIILRFFEKLKNSL